MHLRGKEKSTHKSVHKLFIRGFIFQFDAIEKVEQQFSPAACCFRTHFFGGAIVFLVNNTSHTFKLYTHPFAGRC